MIDLLKSGKLSNRLLCEMALHKDFPRFLELPQVSEENYFVHVVHKDIDGIMQDIREAHRKDTTTAGTDSPVTE